MSNLVTSVLNSSICVRLMTLPMCAFNRAQKPLFNVLPEGLDRGLRNVFRPVGIFRISAPSFSLPTSGSSLSRSVTAL